jgi:hypothetical protein
MPTLPQAPPDGGADPAGPDPDRLAAAIRRSVLLALGRPADVLKVTVRLVTGSSYRVNVVTGADVTSARISHSFFVEADDRGNVLGSVPAIPGSH